MPRVLSERTYGRLMDALDGAGSGTARAGRGGGPRWVFVRCDSIVAVGGNAVLDQCYPGTVLAPAWDYPLPPEERDFGCLLSLIGDDGASVEPREGAVYACLITAEVESDRTGSGSALVNGRPRAFGVPVQPESEGGGGGGYDPVPDPTKETTDPKVIGVVYEMRDGRPTAVVTTQNCTTSRNSAGQVLTIECDPPVTTRQSIDPCLFASCCDDASLTVTASASPDNGTAPLAVNFSVTVAGSHTYLWTFGDGDTSTTEDPSHTYTSAGLYLAVVKVDDCREETVPVAVAPTDCSCPACDPDESNSAPSTRELEFTGGAGEWAGLNGAWVLYRTGICNWSWWRDGWTVGQSYDAGKIQVTAVHDESGYTIAWVNLVAASDCCSPATDMELTAFTPSAPGDTRPTFVGSDQVYTEDTCGPCTVTVGCCGNPISSRMSLTLTGPLAALGAVILEYNAAGSAGAGWYGSAAGCSGTVNFEFMCTEAGNFNLNCLSSGGGDAFFLIGNPPTTCDPFIWGATYAIFGGSCTGSGTAAVVEA